MDLYFKSNRKYDEWSISKGGGGGEEIIWRYNVDWQSECLV